MKIKAFGCSRPTAPIPVREQLSLGAAEMDQALVPTIRRLQQGWQLPKDAELQRLFGKLPQLNERARREIQQSFDRLLGKLMHLPLQSLREESRDGVPKDLLEAVNTLFQLRRGGK